MKQDAFIMKLKPGVVEEYKRRHDEIWPNVLKAHVLAGIRDYSIYFDEETLILFAVRRLTDDNTANLLKEEACIREWWNYNADLMECKSDNEPGSRPLRLMFHMD